MPVLDAYLVLNRQPAEGTLASLNSIYNASNIEAAQTAVRNFLLENVPAIAQNSTGFVITGLPSRSMLQPGQGRDQIVRFVKYLVVRFRSDLSEANLQFFYRLPEHPIFSRFIAGFGIDGPVGASDHWCSGSAGGAAFADRKAAETLIGKSALTKKSKILTGKKVNLVLVDSGLDSQERSILDLNVVTTVPGGEFQIYDALAPAGPRLGHAFGSAQHVRSIAPNVILHDYAILPPRLTKAIIPAVPVRTPAMISDMVAAYSFLLAQVSLKPNQSWVIMNAWAIYRRTWAIGTDIDNTSAFLNDLIQQVSDQGADIIFASGNCGQFSSDPRCARGDIGPARSIVGPNGHPAVTTVGAVRADGLWVGSSSQGPGMQGSNNPTDKPDIAAPSFFHDLDDPSLIYSGTSTSCAIVAATIAALREGWPGGPNATRASALRSILKSTARKNAISGVNNRQGHGVLDIAAAVAAL